MRRYYARMRGCDYARMRLCEDARMRGRYLRWQPILVTYYRLVEGGCSRGTRSKARDPWHSLWGRVVGVVRVGWVCGEVSGWIDRAGWEGVLIRWIDRGKIFLMLIGHVTTVEHVNRIIWRVLKRCERVCYGCVSVDRVCWGKGQSWPVRDLPGGPCKGAWRPMLIATSRWNISFCSNWAKCSSSNEAWLATNPVGGHKKSCGNFTRIPRYVSPYTLDAGSLLVEWPRFGSPVGPADPLRVDEEVVFGRGGPSIWKIASMVFSTWFRLPSNICSKSRVSQSGNMDSSVATYKMQAINRVSRMVIERRNWKS